MLLDKFNLQDDAPRTEQTQKKQVEYTLVGSQRKVAGHTLFQYNPETGEITQAKIVYSDTIDFLTQKPMGNQKVNILKGCIYLQALNKKNCIKRLRKRGYSKFV